MVDDRRDLYADALSILLSGGIAELVVDRNFRLLAEVARLAQYDAPIDLSVTDRALYQAWRNAVTKFHLSGWTYMTAQRVVAVAILANKPIPVSDCAARNPPLQPGAPVPADF